MLGLLHGCGIATWGVPNGIPHDLSLRFGRHPFGSVAHHLGSTTSIPVGLDRSARKRALRAIFLAGAGAESKSRATTKTNYRAMLLA